MDKSRLYAYIIGMVFLVILGLAVGYTISLWRLQSTKEPPSKISEEALILNEQVRSLSPSGQTLLNERILPSALAGGGYLMSGIAIGTDDKEKPITLKDGMVVGKSLLSMKVLIPDIWGEWRSILLPLIVEDNNGVAFIPDLDAEKVQEQMFDQMLSIYNLWFGREVTFLVFVEDLDERYAWIFNLRAPDDPNNVFPRSPAEVPWRTDLVKAYENSWANEITEFRKTGTAGRMEYLFYESVQLYLENDKAFDIPEEYR
jgi:hypothetical protein